MSQTYTCNQDSKNFISDEIRKFQPRINPSDILELIYLKK